MTVWDRITSEAPGHLVGWSVAAMLGGVVWLFRTVLVQSIEREQTRHRLDSIDHRLDEIQKYLMEK